MPVCSIPFLSVHFTEDPTWNFPPEGPAVSGGLGDFGDFGISGVSMVIPGSVVSGAPFFSPISISTSLGANCAGRVFFHCFATNSLPSPRIASK